MQVQTPPLPLHRTPLFNMMFLILSVQITTITYNKFIIFFVCDCFATSKVAIRFFQCKQTYVLHVMVKCLKLKLNMFGMFLVVVGAFHTW